MPRLTGRVPNWFQRVVAILTLLGLMGGIRMLDRAISASLDPTYEARSIGEPAAVDAMTEGWAERLHLRLDPFMMGREHAWVRSACPSEGSSGGVHSGGVSSDAGKSSGARLPGIASSGQMWSGDASYAAAGGQGSAANGEIPADFASAHRSSATSGRDVSTKAEFASTSPLTTPPPHRFLRVQATGYTSRVEETDDSPFITASSLPPGVGTIALSRDLLRTFTPNAPFDFRDKVLIPGVGVFEVRDTMHPRWTEKADLWFTSVEQARAWGHRTIFLTRIHESAETIALHVR